MKTPRIISALPILLVAAISPIMVPSAEAVTLTITTGVSDGGFDGWIDMNNTSSSTSASMDVGNVLGYTGYARASTVLMFDLASLASINSADILSVSLSYYVVSMYGSTNVTLFHGTKTSEALVYGVDVTGAMATNATWTSILGVVSPNSTTKISSIDVTSVFLADLTAENAFSSYRLVQADTYGSQLATTAWGSTIASSENTSGYLVPTLTISVVPEPSPVNLLLAGGVFAGMVLVLKRARRSGCASLT